MAEISVKITLLVNNHATEGLKEEHGFAAWIESGDHRILFDTGQSGALQVNAAHMGINLEDADTLVLSHGHYDHTGTLPEFLAVNSKAQLYMCATANIDRYSCKPGTDPRSIGIPEMSRKALEALPSSRIHILEAPHYLAPGIGITGPVPRYTHFEDTGGPFFLDDESKEADDLDDDQSMWFETDEGLIILLGCCHAGIVNTVAYIRKVSGIEKVCGIIGGMHLVNADQLRLDATVNAMTDWKPEFLVPCHCTGDDATEKMVNTMGNNIVSPGYAGMVIEVTPA